MTFLELASRCEEADGPDRELDALIEVELQRHYWPDARVYKINRVPSAGAGKRGVRNARILFQRRAYTSSLDAAMKSVPEAHDWLVRNDGDGAFANVSRKDSTNRVTAWREGGPRPSEEQLDREGTRQGNRYCRAATPALALCGAAFKARAASADTRP